MVKAKSVIEKSIFYILYLHSVKELGFHSETTVGVKAVGLSDRTELVGVKAVGLSDRTELVGVNSVGLSDRTELLVSQTGPSSAADLTVSHGPVPLGTTL